MYALMKRLSSVVRQLAERHARLQSEARRLEETVAVLEKQAAKARAEVAAIAALLPTFDIRVDPGRIEPIAGQGRHGKRGSFRNALRELLTSFGAEWAETGHLALLLRHHFDLTFHTYDAERTWIRNVLRPRLRELVDQGLAERFKVGPHHNDKVLWRLVPVTKEPSLADLFAQAEAAGLAVAI